MGVHFRTFTMVGGFWERLVQIVKRTMNKIIGKAVLSYDELLTVIAEIECVMNLRPLCYLYDEIKNVITPNHLIFGQRKNFDINETLSETIKVETSETLGKRVRYLNVLIDHYINRWKKEYLTEEQKTAITTWSYPLNKEIKVL